MLMKSFADRIRHKIFHMLPFICSDLSVVSIIHSIIHTPVVYLLLAVRQYDNMNTSTYRCAGSFYQVPQLVKVFPQHSVVYLGHQYQRPSCII